jgi:pentatricopeptide repeat domain-containing protein 1
MRVGAARSVEAGGGLYSQPLRGLVSSAVALGRGGGRGRGGGEGSGRGVSPQGKTSPAAEVLRARGREEVDSVLQAAQLDDRQLLPLIKEIGCARGDVHKLDWLWAWAKKQTGLRLDVAHHNAYITQLGARKRVKDALELYAGMPAARVKPTEYTYTALIDACAKSAQWERARAVWEEMKAAGVKPNVKTYSALISAYGSSGQWEPAMAALEEMKAAGVKPNDITYNALITACGNGGQWERARAVLEDMKAAAVRPTVVTYSALITGYGNGGQWERAMEVFADMKAARVKPNVYTFSALICAFANGAQWQPAMEVFAEMKAAGVQPNVKTYEPLLSVLWKAGQRRSAIDLYLVASNAGVYPLQAERTLHEIDLHETSAGAAQAATTLWLRAIASASPATLPATFSVVTGQGNHSAGESEVKDAVVAFLLEELGGPFQAPSDNPGCLKAERDAVVEWLGALGDVDARVYADERPGS